ncbi:MAG: MlaD family protein [Bacteroidota bacterium]|nr:MlaD family protein [Bacteroidota bacterium]
MERKEVAQQIKLGAFVLAGVTLFLVSVFLIGSENNVFSRTFSVAAVFRNVEGLKPGDNVWLSGVKIGTVSDVKIISEGKVVVNLALKEDQNKFIQTDAIASIGSDGLVGSKIVVIRPGRSTSSVVDSDTLKTISPTDTQDILNLARDVGENTRSLTSDLRTMASRINEGKGIVGELLNDGTIAQEIRAAILNLRKTGMNTAEASAELHGLMYELRHGPGLLPTLVSDTAYANTFRNALANVERVSANAGEVSEGLESLASKIHEQNNAVGVLLGDSVVADQLRTTIENTAQASEKLDENMEALQHNFLFRRYFRKQQKREARQEREAASSKSGD